MRMPVMNIRIVRMPVRKSGVVMGMGMRLPRRIGFGMDMLMVFVVHVFVGMRHGLVGMPVFVIFGKVQPHPESHQPARQPEHHPRHVGGAVPGPIS